MIDCLVPARRPDELDHPAVQHIVDVHVLGSRAELVHGLDRHGRAQALQWMHEALVLENAKLVLDLRIARERP